ncbi:MAG: ACT domain-containing protein [Prolixibacteraceae bacterium]
MSDRIIRLGGSHIGNASSINNLKDFLKSSESRNFVVFSSVPEIFDEVEKSIGSVFDRNDKNSEIIRNLKAIYSGKTGTEPSVIFCKLTEQFINILNGIALIGDYSEALKDQVLSFSEKFSAEILAEQWNSKGKKAHLLWPEEIGLKASADFGNATFLSVDTGKLQNLSAGTYLLAGSYGVMDSGKVARAGKSAADYTAAFITKSLEAQKLELWGLDFDFTRADEKIVPNPQKIKRLTYSEASELAYFDHYSFHPRTVEPLEPEHIPIQILNTNSAKGEVDTIINTETFVEDQIVKSVAYSDDISLLKLDGPGVGLKPGILAKVTSQLNGNGINIKSVITSQISINLILEAGKGEKAVGLIRLLGFPSVQEIKLLKDITLIGVIGHGMQQNYGVSARIFNAVAQNKINVVLSGSGASDLVSYLIVRNSDKEKSVREIYKAFFKEN